MTPDLDPKYLSWRGMSFDHEDPNRQPIHKPTLADHFRDMAVRLHAIRDALVGDPIIRAADDYVRTHPSPQIRRARARARQRAATTTVWWVLVIAGILMLVFFAGRASAATWHGHTVRAQFAGQIDATPCPSGDCLRGFVAMRVDGRDVHDYVTRCAWPRHPRILAFQRGHHHGYHPHAWYAKVRTCGRYYWWRFK